MEHRIKLLLVNLDEFWIMNILCMILNVKSGTRPKRCTRVKKEWQGRALPRLNVFMYICTYKERKSFPYNRPKEHTNN